MQIIGPELSERVPLQIRSHSRNSVDLFVIDQVGNRHPVAGQRPCFVRTDHSHCSQSFDYFQVVHKNVVFQHSLSG
jgi:hypothetical protein